MNELSQVQAEAGGEGVQPGNVLALFKTKVPTVLAADKEGLLDRLAAELRNAPRDISTEAGRTKIRAMMKKIGGTKMDFVRLADGLTEEWRNKTAAVKTEVKFLTERFDQLRDNYGAELAEYEAAQRAIVAENSAAIERMMAIGNPMHGGSAADYAAAITELQAVSARNWDMAFRARASDVFAGALDRLQSAKAQAEQREAEAAELARLREESAERERQAQAEAAERERLAEIERRRHEAAELARKAAEAARVEAEQRAARELQAEREAAAAREREAAERLAREEQARRDIEAKAERDRLQAIEDARVAQEVAVEAERKKAARADYHRRMLQHVKNCGLGFIDDQLQPLGILEHELTRKIKYDAENFGDLLPEALAARDTALEAINRSLQKAREKAADEAARAEKEAADQRRAANKAHRQKINQEVLADLKAEVPDLSEELARQIIVAIATKKIRNLTIGY